MVDCWRDAVAWQTRMQRIGRWEEEKEKKKKYIMIDLGEYVDWHCKS